MSSDTTLKLGVDTSDVEKAQVELDKLAESASKAERFAKFMGDAYKKAGRGSKSASKEMADQAKAAEKSLDASYASAVKLGGVIGTSVAVGFGALAANLIATVRHLDDISKSAQALGTTVERMSALDDAARRTGNGFGEAMTMAQQFMRTLRQVNSESEQGRIIENLGLNIKDLKSQDILVSLQQVAAAFNKYPDDGNKALQFQRLFNRSFKEGSEILREFGKDVTLAGSITSQQAEQAVEIKNAWDEMSSAAVEAGRAIAVRFLPSLVELIEEARDGIEVFGGFWAAMRGGGSINPFKTNAENLAAVNKEIEEYEKRYAARSKVFATDDDRAANLQLETEKLTGLYAKREYLQRRENDRQRKENRTLNLDGFSAGDEAKPASLPPVETAAEYAERRRLESARFSSNISGIQREMQTASENFARAQSVMDGMRERGAVSDQDYYDSKRAMAQASSEVVVAGLAKEAAALRARGGTAAELIGFKDQALEKDRQIARVRADTATVVAETYAQEEHAIKRVIDTMGFALRADKESFDAAMERQALMLSLVGERPKITDRIAGSFGIQEQYNAQIRAVEMQRDQAAAARELTEAEADGYREKIAGLVEYRDAHLAAYGAMKDKQDAVSRDPLSGISNAMQEYIESVENASQTTEQLFTRAFKGAEDSLVNFVMTGKLEFKSFVQSVIGDLVRMQIQMMMKDSMKGGWMGTLFGALTGKLAGGGAASAGGAFLVGEEGPELLMMGSQSGTIIPNGASVGGGVSVSMPMHVSIDARSDQAQVFQIVQASIAEGQRAMYAQLRAQGVM